MEVFTVKGVTLVTPFFSQTVGARADAPIAIFLTKTSDFTFQFFFSSI